MTDSKRTLGTIQEKATHTRQLPAGTRFASDVFTQGCAWLDSIYSAIISLMDSWQEEFGEEFHLSNGYIEVVGTSSKFVVELVQESR
jgi:hypothetical protein